MRFYRLPTAFKLFPNLYRIIVQLLSHEEFVIKSVGIVDFRQRGREDVKLHRPH